MPPYTPENDEGVGRRQLMAAALFLCLAFTALHIAPEPQQHVAAALRGTVLQPFIAVQEGIAQNRVRNLEADVLRASLDSAVSALTSQTTLAEENARLRALLDLSSRAAPEYRAANVIRAGTPGSESMYMLDVGFRDGVRVNAPVVGRDGLVGVVREVQAGTAIGLDWTHPDFAVFGMTVDGESYGVVEARRGDFREGDRLILDGVPYHVLIEDGTLIVTSGLGGIYPRGIPLGRVFSLAEADAGWRKSYWLEPAVHPGSVTQVLVAVRGPDGTGAPSDEDGQPGAQGSVVVDRSHFWPLDTVPAEVRDDPGGTGAEATVDPDATREDAGDAGRSGGGP